MRVSIYILVILFTVFMISCAMNDVIWEIKEKGEVYSVLFSLIHKKLIITSEYGLKCFNLQTGENEWSDREIISLYKPSLLNGELITGSRLKNNIYFIDIQTGEYTKIYEVDGRVLLTAVGEGNLLYFVSRKGKKNYLGVLNLATKEKEILFEFDGHVKSPLIIHNEDVIISTYEEISIGKLYCINKNTGRLKWEKRIYDRGVLTEGAFVKVDNSIFYVDMREDIKNSLVEIDIQTGEVIRKIKPKASEYFTYMDYVTDSHILSSGENILLFGHSVFIYNTINEEIKELFKKPSRAILANDNIIYHDGEIVYLFEIQGKKQQVLYRLNGKQVFAMYPEGQFLLLILADNIQETMANNRDFTYVLFRKTD